MRVACVQTRVTTDRDDNVARAARLVERAASDGAELVVLGEKWPLIGEPETLRAGAEPIDGSSVSLARDLAQQHAITLVAGSIAIRRDADTITNTCLVIDASGEIVASYDKQHMFDVRVGDQEYLESAVTSPGSGVVATDVAGTTIGLTICYDLRFPELYRLLALKGARIITVPAAFTRVTGEAHWEVLLRARAIENQCFVVAANLVGEHEGGKQSWGHSMIVDPWGRVLAEAGGEGDELIVVGLDMDAMDDIRASLPSLENRRPDVYELRALAVDHER